MTIIFILATYTLVTFTRNSLSPLSLHCVPSAEQTPGRWWGAAGQGVAAGTAETPGGAAQVWTYGSGCGPGAWAADLSCAHIPPPRGGRKGGVRLPDRGQAGFSHHSSKTPGSVVGLPGPPPGVGPGQGDRLPAPPTVLVLPWLRPRRLLHAATLGPPQLTLGEEGNLVIP